MYPILARYGPFFLYTYTVLMGLALAAGIGLAAWLERRDGRERPGWIDGLLIALVAALIGGRIGFVWANWSYYQDNPGEIGLVWQGGLSYHGALLAGLLVVLGWSAWQRRQASEVAGLLAPPLVLGSAIGWLACYFEGCAYGRETMFGLQAADLPDSYGVFALRYQTQLLGVVLCLLALSILLLLRHRITPGQLFWLALLLLSAGRLFISLLRGDAVPMFGQFRLDSILEAFMIAASLLALLATSLGQRLRFKARHGPA